MIVNLRVIAIGRVDRPRLAPLQPGSGDPVGALAGRRAVHFDSPLDCPFYARAKLRAGDEIDGPAVIEQMDSTTLVPPGMRASADASGSLTLAL